ncbi:hypothetical protein [Anaeromyxobacter sp. Fw109-5]|uniref:hypothetical protein n=1 Tax=Anaeromyxobacter sp. (strain Fw109-5) TaxID=404589 RepID=UPI0000ED70D4|nr:hypothetical protein [Anaeromyxobacter sp. Fw109-5]ABS27905.1 hypothetical protein Anae109_3726 [Anaeromyxobacter sp. Fw109-5]
MREEEGAGSAALLEPGESGTGNTRGGLWVLFVAALSVGIWFASHAHRQRGLEETRPVSGERLDAPDDAACHGKGTAGERCG